MHWLEMKCFGKEIRLPRRIKNSFPFQFGRSKITDDERQLWEAAAASVRKRVICFARIRVPHEHFTLDHARARACYGRCKNCEFAH